MGPPTCEPPPGWAVRGQAGREKPGGAPKSPAWSRTPASPGRWRADCDLRVREEGGPAASRGWLCPDSWRRLADRPRGLHPCQGGAPGLRERGGGGTERDGLAPTFCWDDCRPRVGAWNCGRKTPSAAGCSGLAWEPRSQESPDGTGAGLDLGPPLPVLRARSGGGGGAVLGLSCLGNQEIWEVCRQATPAWGGGPVRLPLVSTMWAGLRRGLEEGLGPWWRVEWATICYL